MVSLGAGRDDIGLWQHLAPPGTAARWGELFKLAYQKYGVSLRITPGWNVYRPLNIQRIYRARLGIYAAVPGTSSHGGVYQGRESMAIDVANWRDLGETQTQAWSRFVALCRLVGFTTNFVTPTELWHIGDFDPWTVPQFAAVVIKPFPTPEPKEEDTPMLGRFTYQRSDGVTVRVVHGEGYFEEHADSAILNADINVSLNLPAATPWPSMPELYRDVVYRSTLATRTGTAGPHRAP